MNLLRSVVLRIRTNVLQWHINRLLSGHLRDHYVEARPHIVAHHNARECHKHHHPSHRYGTTYYTSLHKHGKILNVLTHLQPQTQEYGLKTQDTMLRLQFFLRTLIYSYINITYIFCFANLHIFPYNCHTSKHINIFNINLHKY